MEHGAVWLAYAPSLAPDDVAVIRRVTDENADVVATPYPDLEPGEAVVATSWGHQLRLDSVDDPRLERFVEAYRNRDEAPEARDRLPAAGGLDRERRRGPALGGRAVADDLEPVVERHPVPGEQEEVRRGARGPRRRPSRAAARS